MFSFLSLTQLLAAKMQFCIVSRHKHFPMFVARSSYRYLHVICTSFITVTFVTTSPSEKDFAEMNGHGCVQFGPWSSCAVSVLLSASKMRELHGTWSYYCGCSHKRRPISKVLNLDRWEMFCSDMLKLVCSPSCMWCLSAESNIQNAWKPPFSHLVGDAIYDH